MPNDNEKSNEKKDPLHATILNYLNNALQIVIAWHIYAIFNSILLGIIAYAIVIMLNLNKILKLNPSLELSYDIDKDAIKEKVYSTLPSIACWNLILFVIVRFIYLY